MIQNLYLVKKTAGKKTWQCVFRLVYLGIPENFWYFLLYKYFYVGVFVIFFKYNENKADLNFV